MNNQALIKFTVCWMLVQQTFLGNPSYCKLAVALREEYPNHSWSLLLSLARQLVNTYHEITDLEVAIYREVAEGKAHVF